MTISVRFGVVIIDSLEVFILVLVFFLLELVWYFYILCIRLFEFTLFEVALFFF